MNNLTCTSCTRPPDKLFKCDYCRIEYCQECSALTSSEVKVMQLKNNRTMVFACKNCQSVPIHEVLIRIKAMETAFLEEIKKVYSLIEAQKQEIATQTEVMNTLSLPLESKKRSNIDSSKSYAHVVSSNKEVLVVKPKEKQESNKTKNELKEKIDPRRLAIAVENIKEGKEGAVIINCNNSNTKEKIKEKVESELGGRYSVADGVQRNPKVIIRGVEEDFINVEDENIITDSLKEQNDLIITDKSVLQVQSKYKQKDKRNKGNIILTVDVALKDQMCQLGKVNIGWRRCVVHEYYAVRRCFHCARYGHKAGDCQNSVACFKCAGPHKTNECSEDKLKCINCEETNKKFGKTLKTDHAVTNPDCACYKRILQLEANKTKQS